MGNIAGFEITADEKTMDFHYGKDVFHPTTEKRRLEDIRSSLSDPTAAGPDILYSIAMDVGEKKDQDSIVKRNLLFGVVTYAKGCIGKEPIRSQGHIHAISPSCNASTCEVYEIWEGEAYIYMQQYGHDDAGSCYAIHATPGDVVVVPPGWVHATVNANINKSMTFGAWCVRDFGFAYEDVRRHKGIAFFPIVKDSKISWEMNPHYKNATLKVMDAIEYPQFQIEKGVPIYKQFQENPDKFLFVSNPSIAQKEWEEFQ